MPENTVKVDRTTRWGNPFPLDPGGGRTHSVANYSAWITGKGSAPDGQFPPSAADIQQHLRGKNLACWCPLDGPCHAAVLLEIANGLSVAD